MSGAAIGASSSVAVRVSKLDLLCIAKLSGVKRDGMRGRTDSSFGAGLLRRAGRLVTSDAAGYGSVVLEPGLRMAVAIEAKAVESCLDSLFEIRATAAVTLHAQSSPVRRRSCGDKSD